jgi:hypothetical protein
MAGLSLIVAPFFLAFALLSSSGRAAEAKKLIVSGGMDQRTSLGCLKCSTQAADAAHNKFAPHAARDGWKGLPNAITPYGAWNTNPAPGTCCGI